MAARCVAQVCVEQEFLGQEQAPAIEPGDSSKLLSNSQAALTGAPGSSRRGPGSLMPLVMSALANAHLRSANCPRQPVTTW